MDKKQTEIDVMKASLLQSDSSYSPERLEAELQSLSVTHGMQPTIQRIVCDSEPQRMICEKLEPRYLNFTKQNNDEN